MPQLSTQWQDHISTELKKKYMAPLKAFVSQRRTEVNVYPSAELTFNAFLQCPYDNLKVIIVGQEPYNSSGTADGLAFSANGPTPPILKNIFQEIFSDYYLGETGGIDVFQHNDLSQWAWQGVLLLNSVWTVEEGKSGSHKGKGWEKFTEATIKLCNEHKHKLVFMLWGKDAQEYEKFIDKEKHLVLKTDHPGSALYTPTKWFGNKHFSKANEWIKKHYFNRKMPINWGVFTNTSHIN
jgi:uracil-DNA glycosylase